MKYIDIHGHIGFEDYGADRQEVIERARNAGVGMITVGTDIDTSREAADLAAKNEGMYATIGTHPTHESISSGVDLKPYQDIITNDAAGKVVAIGECGLDYFHPDESSIPSQMEGFEKMIDLANESKKPLMLHIRNGVPIARSAYKDAHEIIRNRAKVLGNLHFFAGNIDEARIFLDLGYYFSFTGVITFARKYDEVIKYIPLERIMSETDCPLVSPVPYRGKRNEPLYVIEVVKAIAKIKGKEKDEEVDEVANQLMKNAVKFFGLKSA